MQKTTKRFNDHFLPDVEDVVAIVVVVMLEIVAFVPKAQNFFDSIYT
jgi:hypothetical protein